MDLYPTPDRSGTACTDEMKECKRELEYFKMHLIHHPHAASCGLDERAEAKLNLLISQFETQSAICPMSVFPLTLETMVAVMATLINYLIVLINFNIM